MFYFQSLDTDLYFAEYVIVFAFRVGLYKLSHFESKNSFVLMLIWIVGKNMVISVHFLFWLGKNITSEAKKIRNMAPTRSYLSYTFTNEACCLAATAGATVLVPCHAVTSQITATH